MNTQFKQFTLRNLLIISWFVLSIIILSACGQGEPGDNSSNDYSQLDSIIAPTDIKVILHEDNVILRWSPVKGASAYRVYYSEESGILNNISRDNNTIVANIKTAEAKLDTLQTNKAYYFVIAAIANNNKSFMSSEYRFVTRLAKKSETIPIPANFTAEVNNENIHLNWDQINNAINYTLYWSNDDPDVNPFFANQISDIAQLSYVFNNAQIGKIHYFRIIAVTLQGSSPISQVVSAEIKEIVKTPGIPQNFSAQVGDGLVALRWDSATNVDEYIVYMAEEPGANSDNINSKKGGVVYTGITSISTNRLGLNNGTTYYFSIAAKNSLGTSQPSVQLAATPQSVKPNVPNKISAASANRAINIKWQSVDSAISYNVYSFESAIDNISNASLLSNTENIEFIHENLDQDTTHFYYVTAINSEGESEPSAIVAAMPNLLPLPPQSPENIQFTIQANSISISWQNIINADEYMIYFARSPFSTNKEVLTLPGGTVQRFIRGNQFTQQGLLADTDYYFALSSMNAGGEGNLSPLIHIKTSASAELDVIPPTVKNESNNILFKALSIDQPIKLTLSEAVDPQSVNKTSIQLTSNGSETPDYQVHLNGLDLEIIPLSSLRYNSTYTLLVHGLADFANNIMDQPFVVEFETESVAIPEISLQGPDTITLYIGQTYTEPGASAIDFNGEDISDKIVQNGAVDATQVGNYIIQYNVTDDFGLIAEEKIRLVNVFNNNPPTVQLIGSPLIRILQGTEYNDAGGVATDEEDGDISLSLVIQNPVNTNVTGTYMVTYDVTDSFGFAAPQITRQVTVYNTQPRLTLIGDSIVNLTQHESYSDAGATAFDVEDKDIALDKIIVSGSVDTSIPGTYKLFYDVSDSFGLAANQISRTINVINVAKPIIQLNGNNPESIFLGESYNDAGATASDAEDGNLTEQIITIGNVDTATIGTYKISYDVTDSGGEKAETVIRTVEVIGNEKPTISLVGNNPIRVVQGSVYEDAGATAFDKEDGDLTNKIQTNNLVDTSLIGNYTVTYNLVDNLGTAAEPVVRSVEVYNTPPVITLNGGNPINLIQGQAYVELGATANDAEDGDLTVDKISINGQVNSNVPNTYSITYDVTDSLGLAATTVTRLVNVSNPNQPIISLLGENPVTVTQGTEYTDAGATALDNEDGNLTNQIETVSNVNSNVLGNYQVTYNVSDSARSAAIEVTRVVNVVPNRKPTINLVGGDSIRIAQGNPYLDEGATALDFEDGEISVTTNNPVDTNVTGFYTITYTAVDSLNLAADSVIRQVEVYNTPPSITLGGDNPLTINQGEIYVESGATATDAEDGTFEPDSIQITGQVNTAVPGTYQVFYNVKDKFNLAATQVIRTVNVVNRNAPTITLNGESDVTIVQGTSYFELKATAFDEEDGVILEDLIIINGTVDVDTLGTYSIRYNFTDSGGLAAPEVTRTVIVVANNKPVITLTGLSSIRVEQGQAYIDEGATASDNEDGNISTSIESTSTVNVNQTGFYTVTFNVADSLGLSANPIIRDVEVYNTRPVISLNGENPITLVKNSQEYAEEGATAFDAEDGNINIEEIVISGSVVTTQTGSYDISYNVVDRFGLAANTITRTVNVINEGTPTIRIAGENPTTVIQGDIYVDQGATASDPEDGDITTGIVTTIDVDTAIVGASHTVTYTVVDNDGSAAVPAIRVVDVIENLKPVITLTGSNSIRHIQGQEFIDPGYSARDDHDDDTALSNSIQVSGTVDYTQVGFYALTYTVSDAQGLAADPVVRTVEVYNTEPVLTLIGSNNISLVQYSTYTELKAITTDAEDGDISSSIIISGDNVNTAVPGTYNLYYDVVDSQGLPALQKTRRITVTNTAPTITIQGSNPDSVIQGDVYIDSGATADDAEDGDLTNNIAVDNQVDTNVPRDYTVTYTVTDGYLNDSAIRDVTVIPNSKPKISLNGGISLLHIQGFEFIDPGFTVNDDNDNDLNSAVITNGSVTVNAIGIYEITYDVTDSQGLAADQVVRTVEVYNNQPVITLIGNSTITIIQHETYDENGATVNDPEEGLINNKLIITDNIDIQTPGEYYVFYNASDSQNLAADEKIRTVTVVNPNAPVITLNGDSSVTLIEGETYSELGATATDIEDGDLTESIIVSGSVNSSESGTYFITYNVDDTGGKSDTAIRTVIVLDNTKPTISINGANPLRHIQGRPYSDLGASAFDDHDDDEILSSRISVSGLENVDVNKTGPYTVTYTVSDDQGLSAIPAVRTIEVYNTAPVINLVGDNPLTITQYQNFVDPGATATDAEDDDATLQIDITGSVNTNIPGMYLLYYNVTDSQGLAATQRIRTVTVDNPNPPSITLNGLSDIQLIQGETYVELGANASDPEDGAINQDQIDIASNVDSNIAGVYQVTYNVNDSGGRPATQVIRTVTVVANNPPVITRNGPAGITIIEGENYVDQSATALDDHDGDISNLLTVTNPVNTSQPATYIVRYNVQDRLGLSATEVTRTVIVVGNNPPTITVLGSSTLNIIEGQTYADAGATAIDDHDGDLSNNILSGGSVNSNFPGTYILTYDVSDAQGKAATQKTRTVTVLQNNPPVITLLGDNSISITQGKTFSDPGATASDDHDGNLTGSIQVSGSVNTNTIASYTLTYNVMDSQGKPAITKTRVVNVVANQKPLIALNGGETIDVIQTKPYNDAGATATDAEDGPLTVTVTNPVDVNTVGTYTILYNASDTLNLAADEVTRTVNVVELTFTISGTPGDAVVGADYSFTPTTSGNETISEWQLKDSDTLPAGLAINSGSGEISGVPSQNGNYNVTLVAVSDIGVLYEKDFAISVYDIPVTPINFIATAGDRSITLDWDAVTDAKSYTVYLSTVSGNANSANAEDSQQVNTPDHTLTFNNLLNNTAYFFAIKAANPAGDSTLSSEINAIPTAILTGLSITGLNQMSHNDKTFFSATANFSDQTTADATDLVTWSSSDNSVALVSNDVDSKGLVDADGVGVATVFVNIGNVSANLDVEVFPIPAAPVLSGVDGIGQVSLSWTAVTGAVEYRIYKGNYEQGVFTRGSQVGKTSDIQFVYDTTIFGGTPNFIVVGDNALGKPGADSNVYQGTIYPPIPTAPLNVTLGNVDETSVTLSWNNVQYASTYNIYIGNNNSVNKSTYLFSNSGATTTLSVAKLDPGTNYFAVVTAENVSGEGNISSPAVPFTTSATLLPAPTNFQGDSFNGTVSLYWDAVPGASRYALRSSTTPGGAANAPIQSYFTDNIVSFSATIGETYYYVVQAESASGVLGEKTGEIPIEVIALVTDLQVPDPVLRTCINDSNANNVAAIFVLNCTGGVVRNLTGIHFLSALSELTIQVDLNIDLYPLSDPPSNLPFTLTTLRLQDSSLPTDIVPLMRLSALSKVVFWNVPLDDTQMAIAAMIPNVVNLILHNNGLTNISSLVNMSQLTDIEVSANPNVQLPTNGDAWTQLSNLRNLNITENRITDLSSITGSGLPNLQTLNASNQGGTLNRLPSNWNLPGLTTLDVSRNDIVDIPDLQNLTRLQLLNLSNNVIFSGVLDLLYLPNITLIDLNNTSVYCVDAEALDWELDGLLDGTNGIVRYNGCTSLKPLSQLELPDQALLDCVFDSDDSLSYVEDVTDIFCLPINLPINSLDGISVLRNLSDATFWQHSFVDATPMAGLNNLTTLFLVDYSGFDVNTLSNLQYIQYLDIEIEGLTNFDFIQGMPELLELTAPLNFPVDISGISSAENLTWLDLSDNLITEEMLADISGMSNLSYLDLSTNDIASLDYLTNLPNLLDLVVDNNPMNTLNLDSGLTSLNQLIANDNQITQLSGFDLVNTITDLNISNNQIQDITQLSNLTSLFRLSAENNRIEDVSALAQITSLDSVSLRDNFISDASPFANASSGIQRLYLDNNAITNNVFELNSIPNPKLMTFYNNVNLPCGDIEGLDEIIDSFDGPSTGIVRWDTCTDNVFSWESDYLASYLMNGDLNDSKQVSEALDVGNIIIYNPERTALFLDGNYCDNVRCGSGYYAHAYIPRLIPDNFTVYTEFNASDFDGKHTSIINGGFDIQWFGLSVNNGNLVLSFNERNFTYLFPTTQLRPRAWHKVMVSVDKSNSIVHVMLDGRLLRPVDITGVRFNPIGSTISESDKMFSYTYHRNQETFFGLIDNLTVFRRALSPNEMRAYDSVNN